MGSVTTDLCNSHSRFFLADPNRPIPQTATTHSQTVGGEFFDRREFRLLRITALEFNVIKKCIQSFDNCAPQDDLSCRQRNKCCSAHPSECDELGTQTRRSSHRRAALIALVLLALWAPAPLFNRNDIGGAEPAEATSIRHAGVSPPVLLGWCDTPKEILGPITRTLNRRAHRCAHIRISRK